MILTVWPGFNVPDQMIELGVVPIDPATSAEGIMGRITTLLKVAVNTTLAAAPEVLVALKLPLSLSPGPLQANGSARVAPSVRRFTVTVKLQLGPALVEQVTVVVPTLNVLPEAGEQVTVPQLPVVVGAG